MAVCAHRPADGVEVKKADTPAATGIMPLLIPVAEAIAALMKPHAEVVIHDLARGQIAHIANNISRRRIGDSSLTDLKDIGALDGDVIGPYPKTNFDGRELKSITAVLRGADRAPLGLLCINFDISVIAQARAALDALSAFEQTGHQPAALFQADWQEKVNEEIAAFLRQRGLAASALARPDHADLIAHLEREGYFAIRNLVPYLARALGVSRATVYKHLKEVRDGRG